MKFKVDAGTKIRRSSVELFPSTMCRDEHEVRSREWFITTHSVIFSDGEAEFRLASNSLHPRKNDYYVFSLPESAEPFTEIEVDVKYVTMIPEFSTEK